MIRKYILVQLFLILPTALFAKSSIGGAGVLPYVIDPKGNTFVFISRASEDRWSDFGGNFDPQDEQLFKTNKNDAYQRAAAREFSEESMQSFKGLNNQILDEKNMRELLQNSSDKIRFIEGTLPRAVVHGLFIVPILYEKKSLYDRFNLQRQKYLAPLDEFIQQNPEYKALATDNKKAYKKAKKELEKRPDFEHYWDLRTKEEKDVLVSININDLFTALNTNNPEVKIADSSNKQLIKPGSVIKLQPNFFTVLKAGIDEIKQLAQAQRTAQSKDEPKSDNQVKVGDVFYLHYKKIHPGQIRYSQSNVERKKQKILKSGAAITDATSKTGYNYKYNNGTSIFSEKAALPVILAPKEYGYILGDGHHALMTSLQLGAEVVPVKVIADLSDTNIDEFWKKAYEMDYVYPFNLDGQWQIPPANFKDLVDDTNRYFGPIVSAKNKKGSLVPVAKKGTYAADYPVWIKTGNAMYVEFPIADMLRKAGFIYDDKKYKNNPPASLVEKARGILREGNIVQKITTQGFQFVPTKTPIDQIQLKGR